ncbi:hypothetical protein [Mycolicibacterium helvum]|uniref:DUF4352 domain-containing protein n=1 Tax=Mycolicibacterium helvum TaxID=1534349 RepID=A0A7I7TDH9_9MYCO|nr:hypothetical protein [Mycolicibacterium helvum]BBY67274.1 hypothetical protein MHEL_55170 [Mycolicibacterium helvum]
MSRLRAPAALWQRNIIGAVVVALALTVLVVTELAPDWSRYRHTVVPAHVVAAGATGSFDGQTWTITGVRHLNKATRSGAKPLPVGTVLQVVAIDRTGAPEGDMCIGMITDGLRRWQAEGMTGYGPQVPDGASDRCTGTGPVQFSFLLPRDVVPTAVDVVDLDGRIRVRLQL